MARQAQAKDFVYVTLGVVGVFVAMYLYAGVWPPVVVVETNSMMHVDPNEYVTGRGSARGDDVGWGRLGTMDPGDIVMIRSVGTIADIRTYAEAGNENYGDRGDVIAYQRSGEAGGTPIIHRAMTYVEVSGEGASRTYRVLWSDQWATRGECARSPTLQCNFGPEGVTIRELGITDLAFTRSGFITKGDNLVGNPSADQSPAMNIEPQPVPVERIVGKARFELPALGVLKVAFTGDRLINAGVQGHEGFVRIGNVVAPRDIWAVTLIELALLFLSPFVWNAVVEYLAKPRRPLAPELSVLAAAHRRSEKLRIRALKRAQSEAADRPPDE